MRGQRDRSGALSYVSIEERIPASHPLRRIHKLADQALDRLNPTFSALYAAEGPPSVPPEQLLIASLLQAFYGIRSERLLLEQLNYNLLFRWFVGLSPDDPIWHPTTFTKNRERLLNDDAVMGRFLEKLIGAPEVKLLLSGMRTSLWMAPCCRPGPLMPRSSASMVRTIPRHRPLDLARGLCCCKARQETDQR
jgi:transposase